MAKGGPRSRATGHAAPAGHEPIDALITATIDVVGEKGFAHASARAIAERAGVAPGVIYYRFGSMDDLLIAAHDALAARRLERITRSFAAIDRSSWVDQLQAIIRAEIEHPEGISNVELVVGSRTSPRLAAAVAANTEVSVRMLSDLIDTLLGDVPVRSVLPVELIAELAAAAFFGIEVMSQIGRHLDVDQLAAPITLVLAALGVGT